jgi:hypothetical protein
MREFAYRRPASLLREDAVLLLLFLGLVAWRPEGAFFTALAVAIPLVLAWGVITLHFPARVAIDGEALTFSRYGRQHRFALDRIEAVRVRNFLVKDRVLVRILPSPPWRGRYWLSTDIEGFDDLVRSMNALEQPKRRLL